VEEFLGTRGMKYACFSECEEYPEKTTNLSQVTDKLYHSEGYESVPFNVWEQRPEWLTPGGFLS
jgi:hypothetical protein